MNNHFIITINIFSLQIEGNIEFYEINVNVYIIMRANGITFKVLTSNFTLILFMMCLSIDHRHWVSCMWVSSYGEREKERDVIGNGKGGRRQNYNNL